MGVMTILITGAAGFIGAQCVAEARARGHLVVAVVRRAEAAPAAWADDARIMVVGADLTERAAVATLTDAMGPVDVVIHAAAALGGDEAAQKRDTEAATEALVSAMVARDGAVPRLVLVSSFSVYGAAGLPVRGILDEKTPLEAKPEARDAYCRGKLAQEALVQKAADKHGFPLWILRPGAVFGPGRAWNAHLGAGIGPMFWQIGAGGVVPVCHVSHCAEALVLAAEITPHEGGAEICNVIDSDLPTRTRFMAAFRESGWPKLVFPVPYSVVSAVVGIFGILPASVRQRLPGLLRRPVFDARMKPLRYPNKVLRERLGWSPRLSFGEAMGGALADA